MKKKNILPKWMKLKKKENPDFDSLTMDAEVDELLK